MALAKLSARSLSAKKPGRKADGGGLYLVTPPLRDRDRKIVPGEVGPKRWAFLFRWPGAGGKVKLREMGLGSVDVVDIVTARKLAALARADLLDGKDPIEEAKLRRIKMHGPPAFGEFADAYFKEKAPEWKHAKHNEQWKRSVEDHAAALRNVKVNAITTQHVLAVLKPRWETTPETARRLRARIEKVLNAANARGHMEEGWKNPAAWQGHLEELLPKPKRLTRGHNAKVEHVDVPAFWRAVDNEAGVSALAMQFLILTAARSGEVFGATWSEIDLDKALWVVPAERMKGGREHRVPLCKPALAVLEQARELRESRSPAAYVFPGARRGQPLSTMALAMLLRRMKVEATPHGFRSSFRDWCGDETLVQREVAEAALSHKVGDLAEQSYRRGDALEKRRQLMQDWGAFVSGASQPAG